MSDGMLATAGLLLTLAVHSTLALATVWALQRRGWLRDGRVAELTWRAALLGPVCAMLVGAIPLLPNPATLAKAWLTTGTAASIESPTRAVPLRTHVGNPKPVAGRAAPSLAPPRPATREPIPTVDAQSSPATANPVVVALPHVVLESLLAMWIALLLVGALRLAAQLRALALLRKRARRDAVDIDQAAQPIARQVAARIGVPLPRVRVLAELASPMVLDRHNVLLPRWFDALDDDQRRALLAHELAHLQRGDLGWRLLVRAACLPLGFQPLAALAVKRLDALSEAACDAASARLLGSGRPLAECLAACVASHRSTPLSLSTPRLALAMAERPGSVLSRARHLLQEPPMRTPFTPLLRRTLLGAAIAACIILPGVHVVARESGGNGSSVQITTDDERESVQARIRNDGVDLEVTAVGKVEFADDESDVVSMAADARFEIEETRAGVERSIRFTNESGAVVRDYRVDGRTAPFDDAARAWLAETLPSVFRLTAMDAERRAGRFLARGGVDALLEEVAKIEPDHSRSRYLEELFAQARPTPEQSTRAMQFAQALGSDFERRRVGKAALGADPLGPLLQRQILQLAAGMGSDFERAQLLIDAAARIPLEGEAIEAWQVALRRFGSDFEARRVLTALADRGRPAATAADVALAASSRIGSAFERRSLLEHLVERSGAPPMRDVYLDSAAGLDSDFERRSALIALIDAATLDDAGVVAVVAAMDGMGSDFERRTVLQHLAAAAELGRAGRRAYLKAAASLESDFEQRSALEPLIRDDMDVAAAADLLAALDGIQSDFERRTMLVALAGVMPSDPALIEQYRSVARELGTHDRGLAEAALDRFAAR